jgi:lipoprotein-releasing system permease protein
MYLTFALRYFKAKKSTQAINIIAWVTVAVIAFAACSQILVLSVYNGFEDLVKSLYSTFYTDVKIVPAKGKTFFLTPTQIGQIKKLPFVENASLIAEEKALIKNGDAQTVVYLKGVDENYTLVTDVAGQLYRGEFNIGTTDEPGLIVGSGIKNAAGIEINAPFADQNITIILPKRTLSNDPLESLSEGNVVANGVFAIQKDIDNKYAITNIGFAKQQMKFEADEYSATEIKLKKNTDSKMATEKLSVMLGANYTVQTKYQQNFTLYNTTKMEKWIVFAVLTLILIIAAFNMIGALTMLVLEKKKDIGILQSMGASKNSIQKIFLSEGILLGFIGAGIGILVASIICFVQLKFKIIKLTGGSFLIDYYPIKLNALDFLMVAATNVFIIFFASWYPSKKASKQHILV